MSVAYAPGNHDARAGVRPPRVAGLRYVQANEQTGPGLRRRRTGHILRIGKRFVPEFVILNAAGVRVVDDETLDRIRQLAIPPAWENVWICPHANGHIQATGRDARGRKQYRYHRRWREERDRTKYGRMIAFGKALPLLRRRVDADLKLMGLPRQKVLGTVVHLLETTFIRVGNEEYARSNKSFGLTTLKDRHVDVTAGEVRFRFRGKSGVSHQVVFHDPRVARIVKRCRDLPGQELFQYIDKSQRIRTIDSTDVNEYIHQIAGTDFTAKDFRTWAGTVLATLAFHEITAPAVVSRPSCSPVKPATRRATQSDVVRVIRQVAERLGNTPSVCRKCYVHPTIIASYLDGTLASAIGPTLQRHRVTRRNRRLGLRAEEAAVLALLTAPPAPLFSAARKAGVATTKTVTSRTVAFRSKS